MGQYDESYEVTSGLLDDYNAEVLDAWFGTDARYNNGQTTLMFWKLQTDQPDAGDNNDGIVEERWSCGSQWESLDGGKTVEHPKTGHNKGFNANSQMGRMVTRAVELGARDVLSERGPSWAADTWIGLKWHFKRETTEYTDPETKQKKTAERLLPSDFFGVGDGTVSETVAEPETNAAAQEVLSSLSPELRETLSSLKADAPSYTAFVDKAMDLTEVVGNTNLVMALGNPDGLYKEL